MKTAFALSISFNMEHNSQKSRLPILLRHIVLGFDGRTLCVLLARTDDAKTPGWTLPGGPLSDDENLDPAATRILFNQTGLQQVAIEQLFTADELYRTSDQRTVTVVYQVLLPITVTTTQTIREHAADWFNVWSIPNELSIDQTHLIEQVLDRLQTKATLQPVGFDMLPPSFTINQMRMLYEAIFNVTINHNEFEKRVLATTLLLPVESATTDTDTTLYQLDDQNYSNRFLLDWNFSQERNTFLP